MSSKRCFLMKPSLPVLFLAIGFPALLVVTGCGDTSRGKPEARMGENKRMVHAAAKECPEERSNTESYARIHDNPFRAAAQHRLSTFSIDVDTASYSNVRRFLNEGQLPPADTVRIEELVNYFPYQYPQPEGEHPLLITTEVGGCPWNTEHRLARIGLQGRRLDPERLPPRNLVFLIDVSGSMDAPNRLPLVKTALQMLVEQLTAKDRVAIVVYAGSSGLVLPATSGNHKRTILSAIDRLQAGGSTNGGEGIQLAYQVAQENFIPEAVNRVILATDGDFNVGVTSRQDLLRLIEEKRKLGVFLTVLGFGMGNLKDDTLEMLADHGNGHYAYIDSRAEARKVFVEEGAALVTIAKDVKIQVDFIPEQVQSYRLLGYENRLLRDQDFHDDRKDAGDMGSGHTVTAFYELVPAAGAAENRESFTVKVRYKEPAEDRSRMLSHPAIDEGARLEQASDDFRFAASVAAYGMLLRNSPHKGGAAFDRVLELARAAQGADKGGHRAEFLRLVEIAQRLASVTVHGRAQ